MTPLERVVAWLELLGALVVELVALLRAPPSDAEIEARLRAMTDRIAALDARKEGDEPPEPPTGSAPAASPPATAQEVAHVAQLVAGAVELHLLTPEGAAALSRGLDKISRAELLAEVVGLAMIDLRLRDVAVSLGLLRRPHTGPIRKPRKVETSEGPREQVRGGAPVPVKVALPPKLNGGPPMKASRYRHKPAGEGFRSHVEHLDDKGEWCGPLIPNETHPRGDELPRGRVICICCGDFCEDVDAETIALVKRLDDRVQRAEAAEVKREAQLAKLRRAGVDLSTLPPRAPKPPRGPRPKQMDLPLAPASGSKS